jgi:hypothetical protein
MENTTKKRIAFLLLLILLPGCTLFLPPVSIAEIDLEQILLQAGDLPAGYSRGQSQTSLPDFLEGQAYAPDNVILQQLQYNGIHGGTILVVLYKDPLRSQITYDLINQMLDKVSNQILTKESVSTNPQITYASYQINFLSFEIAHGEGVTFQKCNFAGLINTTGNADRSGWIAYTESLSQKLSDVLRCW